MVYDESGGTYSISYSDGTLSATFKPLTTNFSIYGSPETKNFSSFVDSNSFPWLCNPPLSLSNPKCATDTYTFSQTKPRPVSMVLLLKNRILDAIPDGTYTNDGDRLLGAWQLDTTLIITSPYTCP